MRIRRAATVLVVLLLGASSASAALDINVTFNTGTYNYTPLQQAVFNQAVQDWEDAFNAYQIDGVVDLGTNLEAYGGGTLAQASNWLWGSWGDYPAGTDIRPWNGTGHWIGVNANGLWWDPTPDNDTDGIFGDDAMTIIRHELGHILGIFPGLYWSDLHQPSQFDTLEGNVVGGVFDPGGVNMPMWGDNGHTAVGSDLMYPYYSGGRTGVEDTMEMFAVMYDLQPIPEPMTMSLLAVGGLALLRRRRK